MSDKVPSPYQTVWLYRSLITKEKIVYWTILFLKGIANLLCKTLVTYLALVWIKYIRSTNNKNISIKWRYCSPTTFNHYKKHKFLSFAHLGVSLQMYKMYKGETLTEILRKHFLLFVNFWNTFLNSSWPLSLWVWQRFFLGQKLSNTRGKFVTSQASTW